MADLQFIVREDPRGLVASITGEAGIPQTGGLERQITSFIARQPNRLVLDLKGLTFIGSLGMGSLVTLRRSIVRRNGDVLIAAARPQVIEAFRRAGLHRAFQMFDTVEEALDAPKAAADKPTA